MDTKLVRLIICIATVALVSTLSEAKNLRTTVEVAASSSIGNHSKVLYNLKTYVAHVNRAETENARSDDVDVNGSNSSAEYEDVDGSDRIDAHGSDNSDGSEGCFQSGSYVLGRCERWCCHQGPCFSRTGIFGVC